MATTVKSNIRALRGTGRPGGVTKVRLAADMMRLERVPAHPDYFDGEQAKVFKRICETLIARQTMTEGDVLTVANYAVLAVDVGRLQKVIDKFGMTMVNDKGDPVPRPEIQLRRGMVREMTALAGILGLTPKARFQQQAMANIEDVGSDAGALPPASSF